MKDYDKGWVPLMQAGGEAAIIGQWRRQEECLLSDARDRADLGLVALTFATLAGCRPARKLGLRGWNMQTSPFLDEIRDKIRAEEREIARQEGRAEEARVIVLQLGRQRFGKAPTKKHQKELDAITNLTRLEQLADRTLLVDSWSDLLNGK